MSKLVITDSDRVARGRTMKTKVTLYRDGTITLKNTSKSVHFTKGLRGHSFYGIIVGDSGRALYLTKLCKPPTVAAQGDIFGDSEIIKTFRDKIPESVAVAAKRVDVIHNRGGLGNQWKQLKKNIKMVFRDTDEIVTEVKDAVSDW